MKTTFFVLIAVFCFTSTVYSQGSNQCCFLKINFTREAIIKANEHISNGDRMSIKILNTHPKEAPIEMTFTGTLENAFTKKTLTLEGERITYYFIDDVPSLGYNLSIQEPTNPIYFKLPQGEYGIQVYFSNSRGGHMGYAFIDLSGNNKLKSGVMNVVNYSFWDYTMGMRLSLD